MPEVAEYLLVAASDPEVFTAEVNNAIAQGFQPYYGVAVGGYGLYHQDNGESVYLMQKCQAMVKYKEEK